MEKKIKIDDYPYEYLYGFLSDATVLNKGEKANVFKLGDKVYKVFDAPKSYEYIKNQGGHELFSGKLISLATLDIPFGSIPSEIIYNTDSVGKKDILCYISEYLGEEFTHGMFDYETTIMLYQDLAKKFQALSDNGLVNPDGFNFGNLRIMKDNTLGIVDFDGMQFNEVFTTQSRTDHFDRFLSANSDILPSYYSLIDNTYTKNVNVFNHIALFLYDMIGLNVANYNENYIKYLISDIGIENNDINEKIISLFKSGEKVYFTDADFEDLKNNYKIVDAKGFTGTTKKFSRK